MADEFEWNKPIITAKDINSILHNQYGPECPTRLLLEDETKPIPYKTALINCECMRCGRQFTMTPFALLNSIYFNGFVCTGCGSLSDDELKAQQKENMRVKGIELLKEHGIDVVKEAIDEMKGEKKEDDVDINNDDDIDMSEFDLDVRDVEEEVTSEETTSEPVRDEYQEKIDEGERESQKEITEEVEEDDVSKYMASDDDYSASISEEAVSPSVEIEDDGDDMADDSDAIIDVEEGNDEDVDIDTELEENGSFTDSEPEIVDYSDYKPHDYDAERIEAEKAEAVENAKKEAEIEKQKAIEEAQKKAAEEVAKAKAEMEAKMKAELEAEKAKATAEIEAAKKAKENAEQSAAEANLKAKEAEDALKALEDDKEPESEPSVTEEPEDELEKANNDNPNIVWIGDECYDADELSAIINKHLHYIVDKLKYIPYDTDSFECRNGKLFAKCKTCHKEVSFDSLDDFIKISKLEEISSMYGIDFSDKRNNLDGAETLVVNCPSCMESLLHNKVNEYHKKTVKAIADRSHFKIIDEDKHLFIRDSNEEFECSCNGVKRTLKYSDIVSRYCGKNSGKDAREDEIFKSVKSEESVKPVVELEKDQQPNTVEQKPFVLKPKSMNSKIEESVESEVKNETSEKPKTKKGNIFNTRTEYDASMFDSDKATNTFSDIEFERQRKEKAEKRKTIFVKSPDLKLSKNDVAKLNGKINPFEREKSLTQEFEETVFYDFIEQLSAQTDVPYKLILNENSYEIPVIDFESGIRIICSNLDDSDLFNVKYEWINPRVPFSFFNETAEDDGTGTLKRKRKKYKWLVLFSDSVTYAKEATFEALVKYINPEILAYKGKRIVLQDNFIFQYTKNDQYIRDFDRRYSTFPSRKPSNGHVGIIARWTSSAQATTKDVLKFRMQMENKNSKVNNLDSLASDYNEFMVASIKYIESFNTETNRVIYTITEYVEVGSSIVADGFNQCLRALLKEYLIKYPQFSTIAPYIVVDIDNNLFPSPSIATCIERGLLCKLDNTYRSIIEGTRYVQNGVNRELRYSYVRRPEYRGSKDIDYMRQDKRMFNTGSLITRMADEIKQAGLANTIRQPEVRNQFIQNMGYVEATQVEIKQYFVNQTTVNAMMTDGLTYSLTERVDENMFNASKMVSDSGMGMGMNNVMMNPNLMSRYANIMNGSPEAKDLFRRIMNDEYQQNMMDMMTHMSQQNGNGNIFNPAMMNGMNPMMMGGMPGMMGMGMPMGMPGMMNR